MNISITRNIYKPSMGSYGEATYEGNCPEHCVTLFIHWTVTE